ncbi:MAG: nucleotidyl transferase AbiEii/AbiGii toxin family protein [Bacteroidales bacterium]|nr:nucleotidyl transferase AbiEii/AbiGii toxin family protein [Bacteroidales bacterium]
MSLWINSTKEDRLVMLQQVADKMHFADSAAEKDWWVTLTLRAIFMLPTGKYMLFKGGTSLSKGWRIISRFSEDIDLILSRKFFAEVRSGAGAVGGGYSGCYGCSGGMDVSIVIFES